ncbi:hypothetical protein ABW20_dc0101448 [Dactylellina cionopaga]|nr:hypothetical protein ABW20_dc0101448 [Dactylellina cionopaga]
MTAISKFLFASTVLLPLLAFFSTLIHASPIEKRAAPDGSFKSGFTPIWWDDFTDTSSFARNWIFDLGTSYPNQDKTGLQWGTGEIETYTKNTENIKITDSILTITPVKKTVKGKDSWTSGRIESSKVNEFACADGKKLWVEALIKLGSHPTTQQKGIW